MNNAEATIIRIWLELKGTAPSMDLKHRRESIANHQRLQINYMDYLAFGHAFWNSDRMQFEQNTAHIWGTSGKNTLFDTMKLYYTIRI